MSQSSTAPKSSGLPEGFLAVPVSQSDERAPLRLCVLVRQTPEPAAGSLVLLRDLLDARVYLGCVRDAAGRAREWIEIWVQNVDGLAASLPACQETFSNASLDARWQQQAAAFRDLDPENSLHTGWESAHPPPTCLDLSTVRPVHPGDGAGGRWELCRDDALLCAAGLPAFGTSLFRYLYQPSAGAQTRLVPVVSGAPEGKATVPASEILAGQDRTLAFNPQGGLMRVACFAPLCFEDYVDLLGGKPWAGVEQGRQRLALGAGYDSLTEPAAVWNGLGHLFLGAHGMAGRFAETFHLKLRLLLELFQAVRGQVAQLQLPFLNLDAESFRVSLTPLGAKLPLLWTAQGRLVKTSAAIALPVETSGFKCFLRARAGERSIYLPEGLSASTQGVAGVRIRKVQPPEQGRTVLEGSLATPEPLTASPHDLLWIRLPLPAGRLDLYGHLQAAEGLAPGEVRFRTVPQALDAAALAALKGAEGVALPRAPFEVVPLSSTPCDLYSLGVLAVRTLLVNDKTTLAVALDEVLSLARQVAAAHQPDVAVGERMRAILDRDRRYLESLGPHRLTHTGLAADDALRLLPAELWCDTLGVIVSLFPGVGPDSVCRDPGDAPALALEAVFNRPVEELEKLLMRSRSLILADWNCNREINAVIQQCLNRTKVFPPAGNSG